MFINSPIPISRLKEVERKVKSYIKKHSKTLVALDIDYTLTVPNHPAAFKPNMKLCGEEIKTAFKDLTPEEMDRTLLYAVRSAPQILIENDAAEIFNRIAAEADAVIGLTGLLAADLPYLDSPLKWRENALKSLNISFYSPFKPSTFTKLPSYHNAHPIFVNGILYANGERKGNIQKGAALVALLKQADYTPDVVIIVDDNPRVFEEIKTELSTAFPQTEIVEMFYTGAKTFCPYAITKEEVIAFWQEKITQAKEIMS